MDSDKTLEWKRTIRFKLAIVVAIGLLLLIAYEWNSADRLEREWVATSYMCSNLRNLQVAQEIYYTDHSTYMYALPDSYAVYGGVTITLDNVSDSGWSAMASHRDVDYPCALRNGADPESQINCTC